jgi:hypothetical protein
LTELKIKSDFFIFRALQNERQKVEMDFIVDDKALIAEMISTMSQLYPKLVEYEVDNVESWDTMPWQLKQTFKLVLPYLIVGSGKTQQVGVVKVENEVNERRQQPTLN